MKTSKSCLYCLIKIIIKRGVRGYFGFDSNYDVKEPVVALWYQIFFKNSLFKTKSLEVEQIIPGYKKE